ncbi:MAG: CRTAC1 family protein [Bryobacterales bacterium]|nr:CRTAC1 family protein [Bryobacterales bacterium]
MMGAAAAAAALHFTATALDFTCVTGETAGVRKQLPATMACGLAAFDYNRDGKPDLLLLNGAGRPNRLLRNEGNGAWRTESNAPGGPGYDIGAALGDFDGDGDEDVFLGGVHRSSLWRNDGAGKFTEVPLLPGPSRSWSVGGAWLDYDRDGRLDLFQTNYVQWDAKSERECIVEGQPDFCHPRYYAAMPNTLWRNVDGAGRFVDVSAATGIAKFKGKGMAAAVADFDRDGRPDVFVTNDREMNFLFRNVNGASFVEQAFEAGVALPQAGKAPSAMGVDARDYDGDGRPDLLFTALATETFPLFRNEGRGTFNETTFTSGLARLTARMAGWGVVMADFDNDGWRDIWVARSDVLSAMGARGAKVREPNAVFRNLGNGTFADLSAEAGLHARAPQLYRGAVVADFDGDGRLDVAVSALNGTAELWRNTTENAGHWIAVDVPQGAEVRVTAAGSGRTQWEYAQWSRGYASASAGPVHFGLGASTRVEKIEVVFASGKRAERRDVAADQTVRIAE